MKEIELEIYETATGKCPFELWIKGINEIGTRAKILTRLDRLKLGNFGDCKALRDGVSELRIHYGPGFRIYYGKIGTTVILLLCGGDKGSQDKDIAKAKEYLQDYQSRELGYGKK
jgi:putative addiction module killer protein